jgi:hypothetical protein
MIDLLSKANHTIIILKKCSLCTSRIGSDGEYSIANAIAQAAIATAFLSDMYRTSHSKVTLSYHKAREIS